MPAFYTAQQVEMPTILLLYVALLSVKFWVYFGAMVDEFLISFT